MNYGLGHQLEEQLNSLWLLKELHGPALKV